MGPEPCDATGHAEADDVTAREAGRHPRRRTAAPAANQTTSRKGSAVGPSPRRDAASGVVASFIVPYMPHPLLVPDANPGYRRIRDAYEAVRKEIRALKPDLLLLYSTQWPSVIGHQVQTDPAPEWTYVDQEWHELGSIPYKFRVDPAFGEAYVRAGQARGLEMRGVNYRGFPVDVGSIVALKLLNPKNQVPASIVSCNMYADRAETIVLGKAARDAIAATGKRVVAIAVSALSNRLFSAKVPFKDDRIHSRKDDEWNRKYLDFLARGRLEDASQLAREFAQQAGGDSKMKAVWWLASVSGAHNRYDGTVHAYEALYGTGAAVVGLVPTQKQALDKEYDEDDAEVYRGDRNVLGGSNPFEAADAQPPMAQMTQMGKPAPAKPASSAARHGDEDDLETWTGAHSSADEDSGAGYPGAPSSGDDPLKTLNPLDRTASVRSVGSVDGRSVVETAKAPKPLAAYAHARRVGDLLFLAGIGPRVPATDEIPGGPVRDAKGKPLRYDVKAQSRQCIANIETILAESGCALADVFDVSVFLIDMERDFAAFNEVYNDTFGKYRPARTTVEVEKLPGPIGVELKVVAKVP
jgi:2-aminophenol/2-amino-5-chlorophenol 1,6-dioxygenase alpha subunit